MPIKKVLTTEKATYRLSPWPVPRTGLWPPGEPIHYFYASPIDTYRIYGEYVASVRGMATIKSPVYPGEFEIWLYTMTTTDDWPSWNTVLMIFNGKTGAFIGTEGNSTVMSNARKSGVSNYTVRDIFTAPDGSIWGNRNNNWLVKLNTQTGTFEEQLSLFDIGGNIGTIWGLSAIAVDQQAGILITRLGSDAAHQISVCDLATGDFIRRINICGRARSVFIADQQVAYTAAEDGTLTAFNYLTGQVYGALHTGLAYSNFTNVAYSWDPYMRRILVCPQVPDTLPDGDCNLQVHGYYPIPLPVGMTPPIPLRYPQKGKTVQVWNRVYGGASEGIAGQELTYTVGNDSAATVSPGRKASENNGVVLVQLAGVLAGANSIVSETSVP